MKQIVIATTFFVILSALPALAQTPDTTAAERYLPLHVGNVWEYLKYGVGGQPSPAFRLTVEADTVVGGQRYFVMAHDGLDCSPCVSRDTIRFDPEAGFLVQRTSKGEEVPWYFADCELDAPFGTVAECGDVRGGYEETIELADGTVLDGVTYKAFDSGFRLKGFVAGVGLVLDALQQYETEETILQYARIDGVEYGEPFPVATESAPESATVALAVFPNPSHGTTTARLSLDRPQRVTLTVYDVLGRRVLSRDLGVQLVGEANHRLDVASLPSGVYVVRLDGDAGARATARIVRH